MLTTPHVLAGMALATQAPYPWGLVLAFLSHFAFDFLLPHWNPHLYTEMKNKSRLSLKTLQVIILDGLATLGFLGFFSLKDPQSAVGFLLGAFLAILPDFLEIPYYFLHLKHPWLVKFVTFEHYHQARAKPVWGLITQLAVVGVSVYLLL